MKMLKCDPEQTTLISCLQAQSKLTLNYHSAFLYKGVYEIYYKKICSDSDLSFLKFRLMQVECITIYKLDMKYSLFFFILQ